MRCLSPCIPYIKYVFIGLESNNDISNEKELTSLSTGFISDSITAATENGKCLTEHLSLSDLDEEKVNNLCPCIPYLKKFEISGFFWFSDSKFLSRSLSNISKSIISQLETNSCRLQSLNLSTCRFNDAAIEALKECIPLIKEVKLGKLGKSFI